MEDYGKPIQTFLRNLRAMGFVLSLGKGGTLQVKTPPDVEVSPALADEIRKRAAWLVKLLELESLIGKPLWRDEIERCKTLACECGVELEIKRIELTTARVKQTQA